MDVLPQLNRQQQQAVIVEGPLIIQAGPGTGKTKTLVSRLVYLVSQKSVNPSCILALTFTKKAAAEMRERLQASGLQQLPTISTFHGLAYDLLQKAGRKMEIVSEKEQQEIVKALLIAKNEKTTKRKVTDTLLAISKAKNAQVKNDIVERYDQELRKGNLYDYDDLLLELSLLLQRKSAQFPSFQHILVDEFQDTNRLQYEIVKMLLGSNHLFVIGDPYQSIYAFRGADAAIFEEVKQDFPDVQEIILSTSYRSQKHILQTSQQLFPEAVPLIPARAGAGVVRHVMTYDERTESEWIIRDIQRHMGGVDLLQSSDMDTGTKSKLRFSDCAVIYRTHHIGRMVEQQFARAAIPYQMIGEESPCTKPHIQSLIESLRRLSDGTQRPPVSHIIHTLIESSQLGKQQLSPAKQLDLQQFMSVMQQFDRYPNSLEEAVHYIDYLETHEFYDKTADKVTLLTMHAAKGLEFAHVYIVGFEDGIIPLMRERDSSTNARDDNFDEEKRLLYVALTRAKDQLVLLTPKVRFKTPTRISPFLSLCPSEFLEKGEDEAIKIQEKRIKKWREKKSQMTLF